MLLDAIPLRVFSATADGDSDVFGLLPAVAVGITVVCPTWVTGFTATLKTAPNASAQTPWAEADEITETGITGGTFAHAVTVAGPGVAVVTLSSITGTPSAETIKVYVHREIGARNVAC